jgi:hypothetical protein
MRHCLTGLLALTVLLAQQAAAQNPLLDRLVAEGISLGGDVVKLSPPVMPDGLSAAEQQQALANAAGNVPVQALLERNLNAQFVLKIDRLKLPSGRQTGRIVDLMFVAHGSLQTIVNRDLIGQLLSSDEAKNKKGTPSEARELTAEELAKRNIKLQPATDKLEEGYSIVDFPLLEKVQISGVGYGVTAKTDESVTVAAILDERFAKDAEFPNRWRPIFQSELGRIRLGEPSPYSGFAGYTKVTQLKEPAGAVFIESHVVFDEPQGWFQGANYLGSKLPLVARNSVTSFRRKLNAAEAKP